MTDRQLTQRFVGNESGIVCWADIGAIQPIEHCTNARGVSTIPCHVAMATAVPHTFLQKDKTSQVASQASAT